MGDVPASGVSWPEGDVGMVEEQVSAVSAVEDRWSPPRCTVSQETLDSTRRDRELVHQFWCRVNKIVHMMTILVDGRER